MSLVTCYLDFLEMITPYSKLFEAERLFPFEVQPLVSKTTADVNDSIKASIDDDLLVSHLASFRVIDKELNSSFLKSNDRTRSNTDRGRVSIAFKNMTNLDETVIMKGLPRNKMLSEV